MELQTTAGCFPAVLASVGVIKYRMAASYFNLGINEAEHNNHKQLRGSR
jgi:hypothetical protein